MFFTSFIIYIGFLVLLIKTHQSPPSSQLFIQFSGLKPSEKKEEYKYPVYFNQISYIKQYEVI